jgi:hypothetical protein
MALLQEQVDYQLQGDIAVSDVVITDLQQQLDLLAWKDFTVANASVDQQLNVIVDKLTINTLDAISAKDSPKGRFHTGNIVLDNVLLQEGQLLSIDTVLLDDSQSHLVITPAGAMEVETVVISALKQLEQVTNTDGDQAIEAQSIDELDPEQDQAKPFKLKIK